MTVDEKAQKLSSDAGYFSEETCKILSKEDIDADVATEKSKQTEKAATASRGRIAKTATIKEGMARKLQTIKFSSIYSKHK